MRDGTKAYYAGKTDEEKQAALRQLNQLFEQNPSYKERLNAAMSDPQALSEFREGLVKVGSMSDESLKKDPETVDSVDIAIKNSKDPAFKKMLSTVLTGAESGGAKPSKKSSALN